MINTGFLLTYWFYYRWKHGKKSTKPVMRLAGMPISSKIGKTCDPSYCDIDFKEQFEKEKEIIKNRFV
jgi:hypothetical protein